MTHLSKPSLYLVALVAIGCLFYACSDEELSDVSAPVQEADFTVRVKNGYLEFKDQAAFDEVKASLEGKDREALDAWESQFDGFTSLRAIDEMSIDAQDEYFEQLSAMDEGALETIKQQKGEDFPYSDFLMDRTHLFNLEGEGIYHLNFPTFVHDKLKLLNEEGLVHIGDSLYKYDAGSIKIIQDGSYEKLEGLLGVAQEDQDNGILVHEIVEEEIQLYSSNSSRFGGSLDRSNEWRCDNKSGRDMVIGKVRRGWNKAIRNGQTAYRPYVIASAENMRKGVFGWNRKRTNGLAINGTVSAGTFIDNGITVNINENTGGVLTPYIQANVYPPTGSTLNYWFDAQYGVSAEGEVKVFGRGGTSCTI